MKGKSFSSCVRSLKDVCRENQIAEQTIRRWKRQLGNMAVSENLRIEEQEQKNQELRKLLMNSLLINRSFEGASV